MPCGRARSLTRCSSCCVSVCHTTRAKTFGASVCRNLGRNELVRRDKRTENGGQSYIDSAAALDRPLCSRVRRGKFQRAAGLLRPPLATVERLKIDLPLFGRRAKPHGAGPPCVCTCTGRRPDDASPPSQRCTAWLVSRRRAANACPPPKSECQYSDQALPVGGGKGLIT